MERIFSCFLKYLLVGSEDREYYDVLEIDNPNQATDDTIKRQYKRLCLNLHPVRLMHDRFEPACFTTGHV